MTTERQRKANRENAKKSTGPISRDGKRRVSKNALSHGLTTPPPVEDVNRYYRIILDDPTADPKTAATETEHAALKLAESEASCDRALKAEAKAAEALSIYLKTKGERDPLRLAQASESLDLDNAAILEFMMVRSKKDTFEGKALQILFADARNSLARRRRRLERISTYRRRAEGRRRRAFRAWLLVASEYDNSNPNTSISCIIDR